ncbi:MAG: choice-of-anchor V domain-containing protein [Acidobacteriota bacterium]
MLKRDRAKIIAIGLFLAAMVAALFTDSPAIETAHGFSSGPPAGRTGAPGELTCATADCHQGSLNGGPGQFAIIAPSVYEPGETYQITVRHTTTDSSRRRWGFQLTALTTSNNKAGDLDNTNNLTVVLDDDGPGFNRQYIEHTLNGTFAGQTSQASWTFEWTAPDTDVGPVILYAAGNQANNNGSNTGDQIYTVMDAVLSGPPVITSAEVSRKKLIVTGRNFDIGAELRLNDSRQKKTSNDSNNLTSALIAKKSGKKIERGQTVSLQVVNPDGTRSEVFLFTRPL